MLCFLVSVIVLFLATSETREDDIYLPQELILNLNLYLDPEWHNIHGEGSVKIAKQVVEAAHDLFQHPSLNTKVELVGNTERIFNSSQHLRTFARNMDKIAGLLQPPFEVRGQHNTRRDNFQIAHVYLTVGGIVDERSVAGSVCHYSKQPITAVRWGGSVRRTAATMAHGLGHVLGMGHDSLGEKEGCGEKGGFVMNNGGSREKWSDCSNEDFRIFYEDTFKTQNGFCLEEIRIK